MHKGAEQMCPVPPPLPGESEDLQLSPSQKHPGKFPRQRTETKRDTLLVLTQAI